jgi:sulfite dehydrogenase (cytochrome) subunit B
MRSLAIAGALLLVAGAASAAESPVPLKDAPGRQLVENKCAGCHSLDYPRINAPFLDRKGWEAEVAKMINAYGAPIPQENVPGIVDYLTRSYGVGG